MTEVRRTIVCESRDEGVTMNAGQRLMLLGALVLGGVAIYFMVDQPSQAKLEADNFIAELDNRLIRTGVKPGRIDYRTAEEKLAERRRMALWPTGLGLLLLGIGWAVSAGQGGKGPDSAEASKAQDKSE